MSGLNWEKDRAKRQARDFCPDDLPLTGSYADQARYGVFNRPNRNPIRRVLQQPTAWSSAARMDDLCQLEAYVRHATHPDFKRKTSVQRAEIIGILKKLVSRVLANGHKESVQARDLIRTAQSVVSLSTH